MTQFWHPTSTRPITTGAAPIAADSSARRGPTTLSRTFPGHGSSADLSSAVSSTNTSEPHRSPGQDEWPSSGTPQVPGPCHMVLVQGGSPGRHADKTGLSGWEIAAGRRRRDRRLDGLSQRPGEVRVAVVLTPVSSSVPEHA